MDLTFNCCGKIFAYCGAILRILQRIFYLPLLICMAVTILLLCLIYKWYNLTWYQINMCIYMYVYGFILIISSRLKATRPYAAYILYIFCLYIHICVLFVIVNVSNVCSLFTANSHGWYYQRNQKKTLSLFKAWNSTNKRQRISIVHTVFEFSIRSFVVLLVKGWSLNWRTPTSLDWPAVSQPLELSSLNYSISSYLRFYG